MAASSASIGYGAEFAIGDGESPEVFTAVAEVISITPPGWTRAAVETTHLRSDDQFREYAAGMMGRGEAAIEINFLPSASDAIVAALEAGKQNYQITAPSGVRYRFAGIVTAYEPGAMNEDRMTATITVQATGKGSIVTAAAPDNTLAPSISGVAQAGEVLTAVAGVWTNSPTFSYQWQHQVDGAGAWANIAGAQGATYLVSATYVTDALRVVVTAANAAGSAVAESAATAIVIAA